MSQWKIYKIVRRYCRTFSPVNCDQAVYHLFSKNTHKEFSYGSMAAMLVIYFVMACWSAGTYISSGLVVPMLLIGGLYGRMVGVLFVDLFGIQGRHRKKKLRPSF